MDEKKSWIGPLFLMSGVLAYLSQLKYGGFPMTAFEWPSIDMGPFFERVEDPQFLQGDFVVESMNTANPRWVFGYQVLGIMKVFGVNWHQAYLLMKSFIVVLLPGFMLLFFVEACKSLLNKEKLFSTTMIFAFLSFFLIFFSRSLQSRIMIGDYLQSELKATPHSLAILYGLIGSVGLFRFRLFSIPFLMASTFTHPSVGFIFAGINVLFQVRMWTPFRIGILLGATVLIPFAILLLAFASHNPLPTDQLIEIYIKNRLPHHYDVSSWVTMDLIRHMSYFVFFFLFIAFLFWGKNKKIVKSSLVAMVAYVAAVFSQYFFIDVFPWRPVVLLGPVRMTAFSFVICAPYFLAFVEEYWRFQGFSWKGVRMSTLRLSILSLLLVGCVFLISESDPMLRLRNKSSEFYQWVDQQTQADDVFVGPLDVLADEFILVTRRGVFISQIFPFSEELYPEYDRRWRLIYGPEKLKSQAYFENLDQEGWSEILSREKIDYIILPQNTKSPLAQLTKSFESQQWMIISRREILGNPLSLDSAEN